MPDHDKSPGLEENSRTLREKRRGQFETFIGVAAALVGVVSALANVDRVVQIGIGGVVAIVLLSAYIRFLRIGRYRRQDDRTGKVRKALDR